MDPLPSLTASGLGLLNSADRRLAESARTFTRSAETGDASAAAATATPETDVVDAAVGVIYGRSAFEIGVKLIEIGRDTEKLLLDVVA
jgi:ABC-type tungstate transport system substrate-binding protein